MKPHDRKATETELAAMRVEQKILLQQAQAQGATLFAYFCPHCAAPQLSAQRPEKGMTNLCTCCAAVVGVRTEGQQTKLCLFDGGIKPAVKRASH